MIAGTTATPEHPRDHRGDLLLALGIGIAAFLAIVGWKPLDVTNIAWLTATQDSFTHYLGWEFFRRSAWTWPPGLSPGYGLQFSSAIIFSDSIPLLAIPLKLVSALLPATFQFTGWWVLACLILQAWFAIRIAGLMARDAVLKLGVASLLVFAPPMLWRLSVHFSLAAHWLLLAAIYLYFAPQRAPGRRWLVWAALFFAATLIHTYFAPMCMPIWLASLWRRSKLEGRLTPPWFVEFTVVVVAIVAALWLGGFFPVRASFFDKGYGLYRLNLLSLINPNGSLSLEPWTWSALLPPIPTGPGDYEGFAYLGLGGLLLVLLALPFVWIGRTSYRGAAIGGLALAVIVLTLFAIGPKIGIGTYDAVIPTPSIVYELAGSLRSAGRFFWPVFYLLLLGAVWLLTRRFGSRAVGPLLLILAAVQICDTYPGWSVLRGKFELSGNTWSGAIDNPRLDAVAAHYAAVRGLPAMNQAPHWDQISAFALHNGLPTDVTYLARPSYEQYTRYWAGLDARIAQHQLESDSIYFLDRPFAAKVAASLSPDDALFQVGDFYVFAPGWNKLGIDAGLPATRHP